MLCALIMAGGKGTRFWPLSTDEKPKQFLSLLSDDTMLQMTVKRVEKSIPIEQVFICTAEKYVDLVREQLPSLPRKNIIVEPEGRNTAPCIALSAMVINRYFKHATIAVLPSDHLISDNEKFLNTINKAYEFVNDYTDAIVTLGMIPTRPETGYGYIKLDSSDRESGETIKKVEEFVEKPNLENAMKYIKSGNYYWNGGMFVWKVDRVLELTKLYLNSTYEAIKEVMDVEEEKLQSTINENYHNTENISVDYAIMEKANEIYVLPSNFGWDDVGNWTSVERYSDKDEYGNVFNADGVPFNSNNNIVLTNKKILLNNVNDLIVVETDEYIMISSKHCEQDIKTAKEYMK